MLGNLASRFCRDGVFARSISAFFCVCLDVRTRLRRCGFFALLGIFSFCSLGSPSFLWAIQRFFLRGAKMRSQSDLQLTSFFGLDLDRLSSGERFLASVEDVPRTRRQVRDDPPFFFFFFFPLFGADAVFVVRVEKRPWAPFARWPHFDDFRQAPSGHW